jgi:DNA-binding NtrC family response regulator
VAAGYTVKLAKDDRELLSLIKGDVQTDLIILDLEMPYCAGLDVLKQLAYHKPRMPIVVHTLVNDQTSQEATRMVAAFLEKRGNSIEHLKAAVGEILKRWYPDRETISEDSGHSADESGGNSRDEEYERTASVRPE